MAVKIVIINNGLAGGGIERASTSMANQFAKWGHEVYIVALYQSQHFLTLDPSIVFIEPNKAPKSRLYVLYMMSYLRKQIKRIKPDTILAYNEWTNPYVIMSLRGLNYPIYVSDRMSPLAKLPRISQFLKSKYYRRVNGIIAQTEFAKHIIGERTGASCIKAIPNPVNAIESISCEKKNIIVTVGRLTPEKGHKVLLEAFARITDKSWSLSIVGDGSERKALELQASALGIADRVFFHGHQVDFSKQLSEAKIFILPSLSEGFPNALIEAMSVPLPCIATRCTPAMEEIVENGSNCMLVGKNNVDELSHALNTLIADESLCESLSKNAYKVREDLAFEKIASEYLSYITSYDH